MARFIYDLFAIGVVAAGLLMPMAGAVSGEAVGTPRLAASPVVSDPCRRVMAGTRAATPAAVATPTSEFSFDLLYLDLMLPHTDRLAGLATVAATRAEHEALRGFGADLHADLAQRSRRLGVWRSLWFADRPPLTEEELAVALDRLAGSTPGRGGLPGAYEMLGMGRVIAEACALPPDDLALLDLMIHAVNADLLLSRTAVDQAAHDELRLEAGAIAAQDQRWLEALIALRGRWSAGSPTSVATPQASPGATPPS